MTRANNKGEHETFIAAWLNLVMRDPELPENAFKVAFVIAQHVHRTMRIAWPSQATIMAYTALSESAVKRAIASLAARGHLRVEPGRGSSTSRYRLVIQGEGSAANPPTPREGSVADPQRVQSCEPSEGSVADPNLLKTFESPCEGHGGSLATAPLDGALRSPPKASKTTPPATPIPPDWTPTDADHAYALRQGLDRAEVDRAVERFRNHHVGNGARSDWSGAWRNWVLADVERKRERGGQRAPPAKPNGSANEKPFHRGTVSAGNGRFYARAESPQLIAWDRYTGKQLRDRDGGWWFPAEWPPKVVASRQLGAAHDTWKHIPASAAIDYGNSPPS